MIDRIIEFAIRSRWMVMAAIAAFFAFGIYQYNQLPIDAVPDITNVQVQITGRAPGYSPLEVESRVTRVVENAMGGLPRLKGFRSISKYGLSQVTAVFADGTDIYFARQLVNERLQSVREQVPGDVEVSMGPVATGLGEIFMYVIEASPKARKPDGTRYNATDLRSIQDWIIRPQLRQVPGVTEVDAIGGYTKQYHVLPDPAKLLAHGLTLADLENALKANNTNRGAGYIESNGERELVRIPGQLTGTKDIGQVVVATRNGVPVRVSDVATVQIGKPLRLGAAQLGQTQTVLSTSFMLIGENSREVSIRVAERLKEIQKRLPPGITARPVYNRTDLVNKTIVTVQKNLVEGAILVIAVLFAFLGNMRAALLTAFVIPLSLFATFTGMVQSGVTGNLMSLGALDFGLIVDGALIIVENCILRLAEAQHERGRLLDKTERFETVFHATREVFKPSLISVAVIVLVNAPIFALTGVEGKMFQPMAFAVIAALIGALIFSITFVPAACALLLTGKIKEKDNFFVAGAKRLYEPALRMAVKARWGVAAGALALVVVCGFFATRMGAEFIPNLDEGDVVVLINRVPGIGIEEAVRIQRQLNAAMAKEHPEIKRVFARTGTNDAATDPMSPGETDMFLMLKPRDEWPNPNKTKQELLAEFAKTMAEVPGSSYAFTQPIQMRFNELIAGVRADLAVKIFGDDFDTLTRLGEQAGKLVGAVPNAADVTVEKLTGLPTLTVQPKRSQMARLGLTLATVQDAVATAVGGTSVGRIYEGDAAYDIVVRLPEKLRTNVEALSRLPVTLPGGGYVPLSEVATLKVTTGPNQISRDNGKRRVVVTANVRGRDLTSFVNDVRATMAKNLKLPPGYYMELGGTFEQLASASQRLSMLVPATLLLIFLLLLTTFGSAKDAGVVFAGIPLALTGGIVALLMRGLPLSITAGVGFITLCGVSVLTGVVMISYIRDLVREGLPIDEAIVKGALTRLRPIMMIGLVASLGFLPMALNTGTGAEVQRPLATVVIGGIISATLLSLFVLPALYRLVHTPRRGKPEPEPEAVPARN